MVFGLLSFAAVDQLTLNNTVLRHVSSIFIMLSDIKPRLNSACALVRCFVHYIRLPNLAVHIGAISQLKSSRAFTLPRDFGKFPRHNRSRICLASS